MTTPLRDRWFYAGATVRWRLPIKNPDGTAKDLTNAAVRWNLLTASGALVFSPSKTIGSGLSIDGPATNGLVILHLVPAETLLVPSGGYYQEWVITDNLNDVQIARGSVLVRTAYLAAA